MVKHVWWSDGGKRNLLAVALENDILAFRTLSGEMLPVRYLRAVLDATIPNWAERAEKLHQQRENPWLVKKRYGSSGCVDYIVYELHDKYFLDQRRAGHIHVSMYGKLNEDLWLWLGDLAPIMAQLLEDYPPEKPADIQVYEPQLKGKYREPGEPSGLKQVLEAQDALDELGGGGE